MKDHEEEKNVKNSFSALRTNKNFIRNWVVAFKLGCLRKKTQVEGILFLKKALEFLGLLLYPWKFWTQQSFIPGNPSKLPDTSWDF